MLKRKEKLMMTERYFALIPAAGVGKRMNGDCPKQYMPIAGKPMLWHVLDTFVHALQIEHIFLVVHEEDGYVAELMASVPDWAQRVTIIRRGGDTRKASVQNGLDEICSQVSDQDWILVHDAARPGITLELINALIKTVGNDPVGGLLALPIADTVKRKSGAHLETVPREGLWMAQTPQMFRYGTLTKALDQVECVTDEASAMEQMCWVPKLVHGHVCNTKVTLPEDRALLELFLKKDI